ncbi:MAG: ABC transporter substrate-binding protein [Planctomycetota bacterium]|nr:ABC transporter substrate-binding protein [Planctomycetota bacterium]
MTRGGRMTLWAVGALLLIMVGGVWMMLNAIESRIDAACLATVARAPEVKLLTVEPDSDGASMRVTYPDGLELDVPKAPKRILSTLPGITEMLCHLGAEAQIVAVSPHCDHPPSIQSKPRVAVQPLDAEGVLAQKADLLIADSRLLRRDIGLIRSRVGAVLLLDTSRSLPHLAQAMRTLALVLGTEEAMERQAAFFRRMNALVETLERDASETPPRVLVVAQWDPLYVLGSGSLIDDLLRLCGCVNVACDLKSDASGTFSEELVIARRPDVILSLHGPLPDRLKTRWRTVPAVKDGRVLDGESDDLMRAGPRILDALERLARQLRDAR